MYTRNSAGNGKNKNTLKKGNRNNKGKKNGEEEASFDESFTISQENALLSTPPPLPNSPPQANLLSSEIHSIISNLKEEIASLANALNELRHEKDKEIIELKTRIITLENNNNENTPSSP